MARIAAFLALIGAALLALSGAEPAADVPPAPAVPDGTLVLGVLNHDPAHEGAVSREWAVTVDPRTGETARRRLPGGTLCYGDVVATGDRVAVRLARHRGPLVATFPLSLSGPPRIVARADMYATSVTPGRLWVLDETRRYSPHPRFRSLREVDEYGHTTFRAPRPPPWRRLTRVTRQGLLLERGNWIRVWDPRTGEVVRRIPIEREWRRNPLAGVAGGKLGSYRAFTRSPSGRWLYFADARERLMALRSGAARPVELPGLVRGTIMSIAVG